MVLLYRFESLNRFVDSLRRWRDSCARSTFLAPGAAKPRGKIPIFARLRRQKPFSTPANPVSFAGYSFDYELVCNIKLVNSMRSQKISVFRSKLRENYEGV